MSRIVFVEERCKGCLLCVSVCPKHIIHKSARFNRQGYQVAEVVDNASECTGCTSCALICPDVAIRVFKTAKGKDKKSGEGTMEGSSDNVSSSASEKTVTEGGTA